MRRVFLDPLWKLHVGYHLNELAPHPPPGYHFLVPAADVTSITGFAASQPLAPWLLGIASDAVPVNLLKSLSDSVTRRIPADVDLLYCCHHFSYRRRPWVVEMDAVWDPVGPGVLGFRRFWPIARRRVSSPFCKRILVFSTFSERTLAPLLPADARDKLVVLPRAVTAKPIVPRTSRPHFHILYMGTANTAGTFELRGGKELLAAFRELSRNSRAVRLTIRADVPRHLREEYGDVLHSPQVRWLPRWLNAEEIQSLYRSADVLALPGHYDNWLQTLEAMSHGLPVVTTNIYANPERITPGYNGYLVRRARHVPYYQQGLPLFCYTRAFRQALRRVDPLMVSDLVDKLYSLADDRNLCAAMGDAAFTEVQSGRFAIARRNAVLREVFDSALA